MRIRIRHARTWTNTADIGVLSGHVEVRQSRETRSIIAVRASNNKLDVSERNKLRKEYDGDRTTHSLSKEKKEDNTYPTLGFRPSELGLNELGKLGTTPLKKTAQ